MVGGGKNHKTESTTTNADPSSYQGINSPKEWLLGGPTATF